MEKKTQDLVGGEIRKLIAEAGRVWKNSPNNPSVNEDLVNKWEKLIHEWKEDKDMPLVIRKAKEGRGHVIRHKDTDRPLIISDNSFAHWVYYNILNDKEIDDKDKINDLDDIKKLLDMKKNCPIPFSMILSGSEKDKADYQQTLGKYSVNKLGWKLCHIDEIGLNTKTSVKDIDDIEILKEHFLKFANPKNMFLVPLEIGGIGEVNEFIDAQRKIKSIVIRKRR